MALSAVDISKYQGAWQDYPTSIVMAKITGGDQGLYLDAQAANNYDHIISSGKAFGGYHFAGGTDPIAEANYFLNAMKPWNPGEVAALDWEVSHPDPVGWCLSFVDHVHDVAGAYPLLYINLATLKAYNWTPVLNNCGLWLADWTNNPDSIINVGYHGYVMLQYSDGPNYDHDEWEYDLETFKKYGWPQAVSPAQPSPAPAPPPATAPELPDAPAGDTPTQPSPPAQEPTPTVPSQTTPTQTVPQTKKGTQVSKVSKLWNRIPDSVRRVFHAIWQSGSAAVLTYVETPNSSHTLQGLLFVVQAAVLAAVKAVVVKLAVKAD